MKMCTEPEFQYFNSFFLATEHLSGAFLQSKLVLHASHPPSLFSPLPGEVWLVCLSGHKVPWAVIVPKTSSAVNPKPASSF